MMTVSLTATVSPIPSQPVLPTPPPITPNPTNPQAPTTLATPTPVALPQTAPVAPSIPPLLPSSPNTPNSNTTEPEFDQLAIALAQLQNARTAIAEAMKQLDDKMQEARSDTAQARKISLSILSKSSEAEAKTALDEVNNLLQKMQGYQGDIQNNITKTIDQNYTQMQTQFATIQEKIRNLQARGITLQIAQAQAIVEKAENVYKESKKEPSTSSSPMEAPKAKGAIHTFFSGIADWIVAGGKALHGVYRSIIDYFVETPASSAQADQKKKTEASSTNQSVATPDKIRALLNQCDQTTKSIETSYISLQERSMRLEESIANWAKESSTLTLLTSLTIDETSLSIHRSTLKQAFVTLFSWLIDGIEAITYPFVWFTKMVYQKTLGWFIASFIHDVQEKINSSDTIK